METKIKYFLKFLIILGIFSTINSQIVFPKDDEDDGIETPSRSTATFGTCYTPSRRRGSCVRIRDCRNIWQLIEKQASYQLSYSELVYLRNSQCGDDGGILVCCEASEIVPDTSPTTKAPVRPQSGPRPNTSNLLPSPGQCASVSGKIYGGKETDLGEFPWMALIEYTKNTGEKSHHCSGSLINDRYILTAAHCTIGKLPPKYTLSGARLGEWDKTKDIDCMTDTNGNLECADPHIDLAVEKTIYHPDYNASSANQYNDIALLRLNNSIKYTRWIKPICLPLDKSLKNQTFLNYKLDISGWGKTETFKTSAIKLKASVEIVKSDVCNSKYSDFKITITDKQLCAGGIEGTDTCNGDSGGPLIAQDQTIPPKYFIAGVVSYGPSPCALEGWAGVYTKVSEYIDWILENIEP